jgi:hypothetical protein
VVYMSTDIEKPKSEWTKVEFDGNDESVIIPSDNFATDTRYFITIAPKNENGVGQMSAVHTFKTGKERALNVIQMRCVTQTQMF